MLNKSVRVLATLAGCAVLAAGLTACESARKVIGNEKSAPDEFAVYQRPPLSLPPEYALRPPEPGRDRPQVVTPTIEARAAVLGEQATVKDVLAQQQQQNHASVSQGTQALMAKTGAAEADPSIRDIVNRETTILATEDRRFVDRLIFWVDDKPYPGTVVDAEKEKKRIQENQALGKPITEGETPQIVLKRGRKGILEF